MNYKEEISEESEHSNFRNALIQRIKGAVMVMLGGSGLSSLALTHEQLIEKIDALPVVDGIGKEVVYVSVLGTGALVSIVLIGAGAIKCFKNRVKKEYIHNIKGKWLTETMIGELPEEEE